MHAREACPDRLPAPPPAPPRRPRRRPRGGPPPHRARERQSSEPARARRAELLASLNLQARNRSEEIGRLRTDEKRLERLVGELTSLPAMAPAAPGARFARLKAYIRQLAQLRAKAQAERRALAHQTGAL